MIRIASILLLTLFSTTVVIANKVTVNDIQFVINEDCLYEGYELTLEGEYVTYQWEDANTSVVLSTSNHLFLNYSSTYCVTVTDNLGVSCNACVDIALLEFPWPVVVGASVCQYNTGLGNTHLDFNSLILAGSTDGTWSDYDNIGVDLSDLSNVDFENVPLGEYSFAYEIILSDCGYVLQEVITIQVVECNCPIVTFPILDPFCNLGLFELSSIIQGFEGTWSSSELSIQNNLLELEGVLPSVYNLTYSVSDDLGDCPTDFDTTIEVIGCFNVNEVLSVDVDIDQLIFTWTDELEALDLEIQVLQGPIGFRDGNTYTMSGMSEGEEGGIEIFINTEGYQYDGDLIIYGTTLMTDVEDHIVQDLILYPNPVKDVLYIDGYEDIVEEHELRMMSIDGIRIMKEIKNAKGGIDLSEIEAGVYILSIHYYRGVDHFQFIKR